MRPVLRFAAVGDEPDDVEIVEGPDCAECDAGISTGLSIGA